jgi:chromosome partition protein MukE
MSEPFLSLEEAINAEPFADVDLALRRGKHIDRDDAEEYEYLTLALEQLEPFYRRFGCELVHKSDGYFYLLPTNDKLGRRHLSPGEMLVGQALTLLYLDPKAIEQGGIVTREQVIAQLAGVMGSESLLRAMNPKRRRYDERVAEETARSKVAEAIRRLATLGFVEAVDDAQVRLRPALLRFAEPMRGAEAPDAALERLVAEGELVLTDGEAEADEEPAAEDVDDDVAPEGEPAETEDDP